MELASEVYDHEPAYYRAASFGYSSTWPKRRSPYQGLAPATRRSYWRQSRQIIDALTRSFVESIAFIQQPGNKENVLKSLMKNLRLKNLRDAETGHESLQWMYTLNIKPNVRGIADKQCLLALSNLKVKNARLEDVVAEAPRQRLEKSAFYRDLLAAKKCPVSRLNDAGLTI